MNILLSEENESLHVTVLSFFFDQLFLFFFNSQTYYYWFFEEWNQVLSLLHNPSDAVIYFMNNWRSVESIGKRLSILCGLIFLLLSRIQKEKEKEIWIDLVHQFEKQVIIQDHMKNDEVSIFLVESVLTAIDGCIALSSSHLGESFADLITIHGVSIPQSLLDLITLLTLMHSAQNPSTVIHFANYSYTPFTHSDTVLHSMLDSLFGLSLTANPLTGIDEPSVIWKQEWIESIGSIDGTRLISQLIEVISTYPSPLFVFNNHPTDDDWCDWVGEEWMGHFLSIPKEDPSVSFTLSPSKSNSSVQSAIYYSNSKSFISFLAVIGCFSTFASIEAIVSSLEQQVISPSSFTQYCILLAILAGIMSGISVPPSESKVLELLSSLAMIQSLPSCVVYPFLSSFYFVPFDSLQIDVQLLLVRCFPIFAQSPSFLQGHSVISIRRYVEFLFCRTSIRESPPTWNELTLNVLIEWLKVMLHKNRLEKWMAKEMQHRMKENVSLCHDFLVYLLAHFSSLEESIHPFLLLVCRSFIEEDSQIVKEVFFQTHNCFTSTNILLVLCSLDNNLIEPLVGNENMTSFLDIVLCTENACKKPHQESICHCLECRKGERKTDELELIRPFILQLRPRILQLLRLLFRSRSSHSHPYYSLLLSYYPSLSPVY